MAKGGGYGSIGKGSGKSALGFSRGTRTLGGGGKGRSAVSKSSSAANASAQNKTRNIKPPKATGQVTHKAVKSGATSLAGYNNMQMPGL